MSMPTPRVLTHPVRLLLALLALPALVGLTAVAAAPASADVPAFAAAVNVERTNRGLAPLALASDLSAVAQAWSQQMAASGNLAHNPDLGNQVQGWRSVGENVGYGGSELQVHNALMGSAPHRANILSGSFSQIGIGIATSGGYTWVTQVFRAPVAGFTPPTPGPAVSWQKAPFDPTIFRVQGATHRPATYPEWAAAGHPSPAGTNTWFVRYPWSTRVVAVTFWADGWQWVRLDYTAWATAGYPTPRTAGWIEGSSIWKNRGSATIYITDPDGQTHALTYAEWALAEFRAPQVR